MAVPVDVGGLVQLGETLTFDIEKLFPVDEHGGSFGTSGEVCKLFLQGRCSKGNSCRFRHQKTEGRGVLCKHWLRGLCKKAEQCEFLHEYDLSKMPECFFFTKYGQCSNSECLYRHIDPNEKKSDCPNFIRGFCKLGPKCRHRHVKRRACPRYMVGFCRDGPDCKFGHPRLDEGPADAKIRQNLITCHKCGEPGHKATDCPRYMGGSQFGDRPPPKEHLMLKQQNTISCFRCGQPGHLANKCPNATQIPGSGRPKPPGLPPFPPPPKPPPGAPPPRWPPPGVPPPPSRHSEL